MTDIRLSRGFALPLDIVGEKTAVLAKTGAGKTNTGKVIAEQVIDAGIQTVILDPVGAWWGLRSEFEIPILGGAHGDLPLEEHAGAMIADAVVESGSSMILDLTGLESNGAMQRFVYTFSSRLYTQKAKRPTPLLLVMEEADEFAPQSTAGTNVPLMIGAIVRIVKRGRSRGIGILSITQRSAALSKNVLEQTDTLIIMRTTGRLDRKTVEDWVKIHQAEADVDVVATLGGLKTGEAWVWCPQRDLLQRIQVAKARSADTSFSPITGVVAAFESKPIDLEQLGAQMASTIERAKENDPAELRKRIAVLERQLRQRPTETETVTVTETVEVPVEVPVLSAADQKLIADARAFGESMTEAARLMGLQLEAVAKKINSAVNGRPREKQPRPVQAKRQPAAASPPVPRPTPDGPVGSVDEDFVIMAPHQKVLDAIAWLDNVGITPDRLRVGFLAGYSPSSGNFNNILGKLRTAGLIDYPVPGAVVLSDRGIELAAMPEDSPTTEDLQEKVLAKLKGPQQRVLQELINRYPDACTRDELADAVGYSASSGNFNNILGSLRTLGLIGYPHKGSVVAEDLLFLQSHV